jgi:putative hydrolase of the HAD superfamily
MALAETDPMIDRRREQPGAEAGNGVVFWDFDGTLAYREGLWRACLVTALDEVAPGHGVTGDAIRPGLQDGFPWHRPAEPHEHLSTAGLWWAH